MTPKQVEEHDRNDAAIREAGRLTVAIASLVTGVKAHLTRTDGKDTNDRHSWVGMMEFVTNHGLLEISVAAVVAGCLDKDSEIDAESIASNIENEMVLPSSTDWQDVVRDDRAAIVVAIQKALLLLRKHDAFLNWAVTELLDGDVITDNKAMENFRELYG